MFSFYCCCIFSILFLLFSFTGVRSRRVVHNHWEFIYRLSILIFHAINWLGKLSIFLNSNYTFGLSYLFSSSFSLILAILADSFLLFSTLAFPLIFLLLLLPLPLLILLSIVLGLVLLPTIFYITTLVAPISSILLLSFLSTPLLFPAQRQLVT